MARGAAAAALSCMVCEACCEAGWHESVPTSLTQPRMRGGVYASAAASRGKESTGWEVRYPPGGGEQWRGVWDREGAPGRGVHVFNMCVDGTEREVFGQQGRRRAASRLACPLRLGNVVDILVYCTGEQRYYLHGSARGACTFVQAELISHFSSSGGRWGHAMLGQRLLRKLGRWLSAAEDWALCAACP